MLEAFEEIASAFSEILSSRPSAFVDRAEIDSALASTEDCSAFVERESLIDSILPLISETL